MTQPNRRSSPRLREPGGTARCRTANGTHNYLIQDAAKRGVSLSAGPGIEVGTEVQVDLSWPLIGHARTKGIVCRQFSESFSEAASQLGVRLTETPELGSLYGTLLELREIRRTDALPLLCGGSPLVHSLMAQLREAGYRYARVRTPLEAILELQNPWQPISSVVFVPTLNWMDFAKFLRIDYPEHKRVLLTSEQSQVNDALAIDHGIITDSLRGPWDLDNIHETLGLKLSSNTCPSCQRRLSNLTRHFCDACLDRSTELSIYDDLGGLS